MNNDRNIKTQGDVAEIGVQKMTFSRFLIKYNALIILVAMVIVAALISDVFFSKINILNLFRQQTTYMCIAIGMLLVMLTGGIDLSVSSIAAIGSITVALALKDWNLGETGWGLLATILLAILICGVIGALNGFLVAQMKIPSFIVTLASMIAFQGVAFILTNGNTILLDTEKPIIQGFADFAEKVDPLIGIPWPVYLVTIIVVIFGLIMSYTSFGRLLIATGSNETAVRLAGISTKKYQFWAYTISGLLCGVAGVIITAKSASATALTAAVDYNMSTIAGVVIGGCSLLGGEGSVKFTVVGVFIIAVIGNIMNLIGLAVYPQMIVKAAIIILAVLLKSVSSKRS